MNKKGQMGNWALIGVSIVILVISLLAVAFPVIKDVTSNTTLFSGVDGTIVKYLGTFVLLLVLVGITAYMFMGRK